MVFENYARYYDALYADKDYAAECDFIGTLWRRFSPTPVRTVLEFGCGTGGHAIPLAQRGHALTGIDRAPEMLSAAQAKAATAHVGIDFQSGDLRSFQLNRTFDAVLSMFAVMGYQTTNDDLLAAFHTARRHLAPGGLFIFDAWYGPAVLAQRPSERVKTITQGEERWLRMARPTLDTAAHTVQVDYTVLWLRGVQLLEETHEAHLMRFLFTPEIDLLCRLASFDLLHTCVFMQPDTAPTDADWNVTWVTRAR